MPFQILANISTVYSVPAIFSEKILAQLTGRVQLSWRIGQLQVFALTRTWPSSKH
jgi:hypothetical protein